VKILRALKHKNIVDLKEIVTSRVTARKNGRGPKKADDEHDDGKGSVYMVFEYLNHDLSGLLDTPGVSLDERQVKCYMKQLLEGVEYMHRNRILHRDIKGSNLLLDNKGNLKIADWGLARSWTEQRKHYTNRVITLWYRPPELLMGATQYTSAIDMWSVGCIMAELLFKKAVLSGRNELEQLKLIFRLCGSPTEETWPGHEKLPSRNILMESHPRKLRERFRNFKKEALDLVDALLTMDPTKRMSAKDALDHDYFWTDPMPCNPSELPAFKVESAHEFEAKNRRKAEHTQQQQAQQTKRHQPHPPGWVEHTMGVNGGIPPR
jgi:cyclin-dependent kinase 12/13